MTQLLAYHSDQGVKDALLARIAAHEEADAIVKGTYGTKVNEHYERCAVGCSLYDLTEPQKPTSDLHDLYPKVLGLPVWLAHLEDRIFEGLPNELAKTWPRRFAEGIPVGADLTALEDRIAVVRLKRTLELQESWQEPYGSQVVTAVQGVIAALESSDSDRKSAAWSAAWSAARSARSAAESAAWSAESAAWSAARSAAWEREAESLLTALREA